MKIKKELHFHFALILIVAFFFNSFNLYASDSEKDLTYMDRVTSFFKELVSDINSDNKPSDLVSSNYDCLPINSLATVTAINNGDWNSANTWQGGTVPTAQDDVVIKEGITVNLRGNCAARTVTVNGVLKKINNANFHLTTRQVMITGQSAELQIGTPIAPYLGKGRITLIGSDPGTDNGAGMGSKLVGVMDGGTLQMEGKEVLSWTKLSRNANKGSDRIRIEGDASSWAIGDEIVIAPSGFDVKETEKRTIIDIIDNGKTFVLDQNLSFDHRGEIVNYDNGRSIDVRAEVGLLSRNIVIEARDDAASQNGFGGHVMCMPSAKMYVSGIELVRMGQKGKLGRYPFHWHLLNKATGQYFRNSSVHKSFNRAVTIHGTKEVLVENNVAYDFIGHGFFLEDGDEENNVIKDNFGVYAKKPQEGERVEPFDSVISVFWITNPNNTITGNAVGGSEGVGIWLIPFRDVYRNNSFINYKPTSKVLKKFENNSVHTCTDGVAMDRTIDSSLQITVATWNPKANGERLNIMVSGLTAYHCNKGFWTKLTSGGSKILENSTIGGCEENAFISFTGAIKNTTLIGNIKGFDYKNMTNAPGIFLGGQLYNGSCDFEDVYLAGFEPANTSSIGTRRASAKYPNFTMKNIMFDSTVPESKRLDFNRPGNLTDAGRSYTYSSGIIDLDGSISGIEGGRITPRILKKSGGVYSNKVYDTDFNIVPGAKLFDDWGVYVTENTDFGYQAVSIRGNTINDSNSELFYLHRSDGKSIFEIPRTGRTIQIPAILNDERYKYRVQPEVNTDFYSSKLSWVAQNSTSYLTIVNVPSNYKISGNRVTSMEALEVATTTSYVFVNNEIRIKNVATDPTDGQNSSLYYDDYNGKTIKADKPINAPSKYTYCTLADFEYLDNRLSLSQSANRLDLPNLSYSTNGVYPLNNTTDDYVSYDFKTNGDGQDDYIDLNIDFDKQIWDLYKALSIKYNGSSVQVYARGEGASTYLGMYKPVNGKINIDLSINNEANDWRENITGLVFRVHESSLSNNLNSIVTEEIKIYDILLHNVALSAGDLVQTNNVAPNVSITSPDHLGTYAVGEEISINAAAIDPDGNMDRVEFKINDTFLSSDGSRPFNGSFTPTQPGMYTIAAKALDTQGQQIEVSVTIMVDSRTLDISSFEEPNEKLMLFPNPSKDGILQLSRSVDFWKIYAINGQIISEGTGDSINISQADKGVYFLKASSGESIKIVLN